jgi:hypothetical protein
MVYTFKVNIFHDIKRLGLPKDSYVIIGSGTLVALGLIPAAHDVDMAVTPPVYDRLKAQGWQEVFEPKPVLKHGVYDVGVGFGQWSLADLQSDALIIHNVPFMSLEKILAWKQHAHRPKDLAHVELIQAYLQVH